MWKWNRLQTPSRNCWQRLNEEEGKAGEGYEDLRRTLIGFFEWRGAPFPEEHADESLNRIARKLDEATDQKYRWLLLSSRAAGFTGNTEGSRRAQLEDVSIIGEHQRDYRESMRLWRNFISRDELTS